MISRRQVLAGASALGLVSSAGFAAKLPDAEARVSIATMGTRTSTWGRVLSVWAKATEKQVDNRLDIQLTHDGGEFALDEADVVARIQAGRWDGAALSQVGLSMLHPAIAALGLPGRYADLAAIQKAIAASQEDFNAALAKAGFTCLGWGVMGQTRLFSRGIAVRGPSDLAGQTVWQPPADAVTAALLATTGGTPAPFPQAQMRSQLKKGTVKLAVSTASEAVEHGWSVELDTAVAMPLGWSVGAIVVRADALAALPKDLMDAMLATSPLAGRALADRPDVVDDATFAELSKTLSLTELSTEHQTQWKAVFDQVAESVISGGAVSKELLDRLG